MYDDYVNIFHLAYFLLFGRTVCKTVHPMLSDRCLSCPSVLSCLPVTSVHCGQTVGWIQMKLGVQVGLSPGHIVLDGDPAPPPTEWGTAAPAFRPTSIVAKRSPISATAELL